jgi:hypothetical protein
MIIKWRSNEILIDRQRNERIAERLNMERNKREIHFLFRTYIVYAVDDELKSNFYVEPENQHF